MSTSNDRRPCTATRTRFGGLADRPRDLRRERRRSGRGRKRERDAAQILHHAIVNIAGNAAPLDIGSFQCFAQQAFTLGLLMTQSASELPNDRNLSELQCDDGDQRDGRILGPRLPTCLVDGRFGKVRLEQQRFAARAEDARVDLDKLAVSGFELVLGLAEVAYRRVRPTCTCHVEFVAVENEPFTDEARVVGVHDEAFGSPQLHSNQ
jgi:hypothetical protein